MITGLIGAPAFAADCPGHPDALGTSRTLVVDPKDHPRIGGMQYEESLPLADHEVVLTFDDGPLPPHSTQVLNILAAQCVKATFFIIGRMAHTFPEGVRRVRDAGHSIGTHTENHPLSMNRMPIERAQQEIDDGIAATAAALGDPNQVAPFFRIPGLLRASAVEDYVTSKGIQTWSADFPADDWKHISSARVYDLAMSRLEAKGRGILLLHDIQGRTVQALPRILAELKARGYRIVHVVPASPDQPKTPTEPDQWRLHKPSNAVATNWPGVPTFTSTGAPTLPTPWALDRAYHLLPAYTYQQDVARRSTSWPRASDLEASIAAALPIPSKSLFELSDRVEFSSKPLAVTKAQAHASAAPNRNRVARLVARDGGPRRPLAPSHSARPRGRPHRS